jgi:hypothetical protein
MPQRFQLEKFEVQGHAIMSVVSAMALIQHRALKLLADRGITPLEKDSWYPLARLLEVFKTIHTEIGPNTVKAVGRKIPENAQFPQNLTTLEDGFRSIDVAYRMSHRGPGNIGGYHYTPTGDRTAKMICDNPYPCAMDEGLLEAIGLRFRPIDSLWVRVEHQPGGCRKKGAVSCTYHLSW